MLLLDDNIDYSGKYDDVISAEGIQGHAVEEYKDLGEHLLGDIYMYYVAGIKTQVDAPIPCLKFSRINWANKESVWGVNMNDIWS
jgi:hypothetical protein